MGTNVNIRAQEAKERDEKLVPWLKSNGAVVAKSARDCTHLVTPKIKTSCNFLVLFASLLPSVLLSSVAGLHPCPHSHPARHCTARLSAARHAHAYGKGARSPCLSVCLSARLRVLECVHVHGHTP